MKAEKKSSKITKVYLSEQVVEKIKSGKLTHIAKKLSKSYIEYLRSWKINAPCKVYANKPIKKIVAPSQSMILYDPIAKKSYTAQCYRIEFIAVDKGHTGVWAIKVRFYLKFITPIQKKVLVVKRKSTIKK